MADSKYNIEEVRFITRDPELTEVYVFLRGLDPDAVVLAQGWHHKAFPARRACVDIYQNEIVNAVSWPLKAPE